MTYETLLYYDTQNVIELWYNRPYCIMPLEAKEKKFWDIEIITFNFSYF